MSRPAGGRSLVVALGRGIGVSTGLSLAVFAAAAALVVQFVEEQEQAQEEASEIHEDPLTEAIAEVGLAMLVAAPLGIGLAVGAARWLARRMVARVSAVSDLAEGMTPDNLADRLPVSSTGDELDVLATALNGLFARIEDGVALQRQFAADASHELRSPLAVLSSTLEVARRRARSGEEWEVIVDRALHETRHMTRLVEALLQLTRAGTAPRRERVRVDELFAAVRGRFASDAARASVQLETTPAPGLSLEIDRELMTVAIGNLVANAIGHSPAGGVVSVAAFAVGDELCLQVRDQGPGVAPNERERIFNPFVRGATASADRSGSRVGLGLGLAIARRVAEGHGARLRVEDAPDDGAVFSLHLPRLVPIDRTAGTEPGE